MWFLNFERECRDNVIDLDFHWIVAYNFANELSRIGLDASSDGGLTLYFALWQILQQLRILAHFKPVP